ncbi:hypothetical protein ACT7DM_19765 [Bacillus cereus]
MRKELVGITKKQKLRWRHIDLYKVQTENIDFTSVVFTIFLRRGYELIKDSSEYFNIFL